MKVITAVSSKGGAGKSNIIRMLASQLAHEGSAVLILDTDEQGSVTEWASHAEQQGAKIPNVEVVPIGRTEKDFTKLSAIREIAADAFDFVLVDLKGERSEIISPAARNSDLLILPMAVTQDDFVNFKKTLKDIRAIEEASGSKIDAAISINRYDDIKHRRNGIMTARHEVAEKLGIRAMNTLVRARQHYADMLLTWGSIPATDVTQYNQKVAESLAKTQREIFVYTNEVKSLLGLDHDKNVLFEGMEK